MQVSFRKILMYQTSLSFSREGDNEAEQKFLAELRLLVKVYTKFPHFCYINYMSAFSTLCQSWISTPAPSSMARWLPVQHHAAPDICTTCLRIHGQIPGGRLRSVCCLCNSWQPAEFGSYVVQEIAKHTGASQELVAYLLTQTLAEKGERT